MHEDGGSSRHQTLHVCRNFLLPGCVTPQPQQNYNTATLLFCPISGGSSALKNMLRSEKKTHKKNHPTVLALIFCLSTNFRFGERKSPVSGAGLDRITIKGERKQRARPPFPLADGMRKGSSSASSPCLFAPSSCQGGKVASRPGSPGPTFPFFLRVSADEKGTLGNCDKQAHQDKTGSAGNEAGAAAATGGDAPWFI